MLGEIIIAIILLIVLVYGILAFLQSDFIKPHLERIEFWEKFAMIGVATSIIGTVLTLTNVVVVAKQEWQKYQEGDESVVFGTINPLNI